MTTRNDITQDKIKTKPNNQAYRDNHDKIFTQSYLKQVADMCPSVPSNSLDDHIQALAVKIINNPAFTHRK